MQVSEEKTSITNLKRNYSEFLGFKFKMQTKSKKQVINVQMSNKAVRLAKSKLKGQIKLIQKPKDETELYKKGQCIQLNGHRNPQLLRNSKQCLHKPKKHTEECEHSHKKQTHNCKTRRNQE